nr:MAG TPA: hypothetical protein [Caudoviricetes sp.]
MSKTRKNPVSQKSESRSLTIKSQYFIFKMSIG